MIELGRRLILGAALACSAGAALPGCTHRGTTKPPVLQPTPPPAPADTAGRPDQVVYPHLLLRTHEGRFVLTEAHKPFTMRGAIFCWPPDLPDGTPAKEIRSLAEGKSFPYRWTLISPELMAYARRVGAANTFIVRLGPYRRDKLCCGLEEIGPPILEDGTFNPRFDAYLIELAHDAGRNDSLFGVSLDDSGWGGKWQYNGADVGYVLNPRDVMDAQRTAFIKHYVELLDPFANVFFEIGNENDLNPTWTPEFERANYALIRATEKMVAHVVVSNTRDYDGPYEAMASHTRGGVDSPVNGKPVMVNEYNPAMSPAEFASCFREMRDRGGACFYWRSDGTDEAMEASLAAMKTGGEVTNYGCPDPKPDPAKLDFWIDCSRQQSCDATPFQRGDHDYCLRIGMAEFNPGEPRFNCPMRNEGDPNRVACEQYVLKAPAPVWHSDGRVILVDGAGFRARCDGGTWLQACDATGEHCSKKVECP